MKTALKAALFAATTLFGLTQTAGAETALNVTFLSSTQDEDYNGAMVFKNYVETQSNGSIKVNVFAGAQLCGSAVECFEGLKSGVVDVYNGTAGGAAVIYPPIQALDIPYLFTTDRVVKDVLQGPLEADIRARVLKATSNQIMLMSIGQTGGWRAIATKGKAVKSPADMKGMKIRTIESPIQQTLIRNMGGSPTPLPYSEVYTALTTGVVEGALLSITDVTQAKLHESMKYLTMDRNAYMTNMWFISNAKFQSLNEKEKTIVLDGARLFADVTFGVQPDKELAAYEDFRKAGGKIYNPTADEMAKFRENSKPIVDWYLEKYGEEGKSFLGEIQKDIADASKKIDDANQAVIKMK